jgi:dipeptidyl-peptidase-4
MQTSWRFKSLFLAFLLLGSGALFAQEAAPKPLTLEQALSRQGMSQFMTRLPASFGFVAGTDLLQGPHGVLNPEDMSAAAAPAAAAAATPLVEVVQKTLKERGDAVRPAAFTGGPLRSTLPRTPHPRQGFIESADANAGVYLDEDTLVYGTRGGLLTRSPAGFKGCRQLSISENGRTVSCILENGNLAIWHDEKVHQLTSDASESIFEGELDWVYQEEVYGRYDFRGNWLSPDGRHITWMRIDEESVPDFTITDQSRQPQVTEHLRYPKAGEGNPKATLHVADCSSGKVTSVDLSAWKPEDEILIVRVGWNPSGQILFMVQDREQRWLELCTADPVSGKTTRLLREESKTWVNVLAMPRFLKDGSFLWESERTGYRHLYHCAADGQKQRALTQGEWQVTEVAHIDEAAGYLDISTTKDGAENHNLYRLALDGSSLRRITPGDGQHDVEFSANREWMVDTVSNTSTPPVQRLVRLKKDDTEAHVVRELAHAPKPSGLASGIMSAPEFVRIPTRDGYSLDGRLTKPLHLKPGQRAPVWVQTYAGPDTPTVKNNYHMDPFAQFLAGQGIGVLDVNVRSSSGRGQVHTATCYGQFGVQEALDLEDAARWLGAQEWADGARIGLTGWSFGGFITAFAMTHCDAFKLGIAGGGVYAWENYDTIYTERYMRTPQHNADGYKRSSVLAAAANLKGHLVIIHGLMDDNVHVQNAMQFCFALQSAGKQFDLMLYPRQRHGIQDPRLSQHMRTLMWNAIKTKL